MSPLPLLVLVAVGVGAYADKKASKELAQMYREDQADQNRWEELGDAEFGRRQSERRSRALAIVSAGRLDKPLDYYNAAMLLQHGEGADDFLLAHILSTVAAIEGEEQGFFMSAAALDRYMMTVDQLQRFGSQYGDEMGTDLGDTSSLLSEVFVEVFRQGKPYARSGLTGKPIDDEVRTKKALRAAQKDLAKLAKKAPDLEEAAELRAACSAVMAMVDDGLLDDEDDFRAAARVLVHGEGPDELLTAHICATTAAVLGDKDARPLYALTLDAYLGALGRPLVFEVPEGGPEPSEALRLHDQLRAPFTGKKKR